MLKSDCLKFNIIDIFRERRGRVRIRTKNKETYAISCRLKGEAVFITSNEEMTVSMGDVLYVPQGAEYTQETESEDVIIVHLDILGTTNRNIKVFHTDFPEEVCQLFCKLEKIWRAKQDRYVYSCIGILYELIAKTGVAIAEQSSVQTILTPGLQYLDEHFSDSDFSINEACRKCHVSRAYFNRLFKIEKGITPLAYAHQLKIQKAEMLLRSGCYTNEEISELCGFRDVKSFYILLKKMTGNTTKMYRK